MCFVHSLRSVDVFYVFMERSKCVVLNLLGAVDSGDQVFDVRQSFEWNTLLYHRHFFFLFASSNAGIRLWGYA